VSRWSADPLRIALAPGEVALLCAQESLVLATPERGAASLLPALDKALADAAWCGRCAEVVLSQHFVRHVLTPPPGKALSRAEERALVAASLREIYGEEAGFWKIEAHSQPPQHGLLGAAVDESFAQQLDAMLARHGFRDVVIRPLASVAARRLPKRLEGWWVLVESGWLSLFGATNGAWQHVSGQPIDDNWVTVLPDLVMRELAWAEQSERPMVWIQTMGVGNMEAPADDRARWQMLPHDRRARGALALAGA
jgi:hypothetical protein